MDGEELKILRVDALRTMPYITTNCDFHRVLKYGANLAILIIAPILCLWLLQPPAYVTGRPLVRIP